MKCCNLIFKTAVGVGFAVVILSFSTMLWANSDYGVGIDPTVLMMEHPDAMRHKKPDEVIEAISRMFPEQDKIELFARRRFKGWKTWGLDLVLDSYKAFPEVQKPNKKNNKENSLKLDLMFDEEY